jgi:hypothetical protein
MQSADDSATSWRVRRADIQPIQALWSATQSPPGRSHLWADLRFIGSSVPGRLKSAQPHNRARVNLDSEALGMTNPGLTNPMPFGILRSL